MNATRRVLICALLALGLLGAGAGPALAHATLVSSTPALNGRGIAESTRAVTLRFSEPVEVLNRSDVTVVNGRGQRQDTGAARTVPGDATRVVIPVHTPLLPQSYTVRYRVISADSHAATQAFVFGVGHARLASPILAGSGGLSDESPAVVAARVLELIALGLLLGLLAFRALVWGPAVESAGGVSAGERRRATLRGQGLFWRALWALTILTGVAETYVLAAKSAVVFHQGLFAALLDPSSAYRLVSASRFGDLLGWRMAALLALVAVAFLAWTAERAQAPSAAGRRAPMALMGLFGLGALTALAGQGHASQAPFAPLQVMADAVHLGGAAIWLGGLPCLLVVLLRAPRALPDSGRPLASATLRRFSRLALWSVAVIAVTGLARLVGELDSPTQLLTTGYGRDLMLKASLLAPILVLARRNRQLVAALAGGLTPTADRLRSVARSVQIELGIGIGIIIIAAILVAQLPGRA
jgi:copper transport protein